MAWNIFEATDQFIINRLGFAKFYRYIDDYEYGITCECSCIPRLFSKSTINIATTIYS